MKTFTSRSVRRSTFLVLFLVTCATAISNACTDDGSGEAPAIATPAKGEIAAAPPSAVPSASEKPDERCASPLRLGVLLDKSGSVRENAVPQMTAQELDALVGLIDTCAGGELTVGMLCNISGDQSFARLFFAAVAPSRTPQAARHVTGDAFSDLRIAQAMANAKSQHERTAETARTAREADIAAFRARAVPIVAAPVACTRTDIVSGVNRLMTYLAEPWGGSAGAPLLRVGVYITDGQHTARRQTVRVNPDLDAVHVLVCGSPDAGVLAPLNPIRFESVGAVIRWLRAAAEAR